MNGEIDVSLGQDEIVAHQLLTAQTAHFQGAQVSFFGVVRSTNLGRSVLGVEYEAFEPLAKNVFTELCQEACKNWDPDLRIVLKHRLGYLAVGQISVGIVVSSRHRAEAYEASRYLIEELKHRAPIWKKEYYEDGASEWVQGHALCQHRNHKVASWHHLRKTPDAAHAHAHGHAADTATSEFHENVT